jgi:CMP-N-acetylneuraminic acid synthetase
LQSQYIDRVVTSTDCDEIAEISKINGADVPFIRPADISGDAATTESVVLHMLKWLGVDESFDIVMILQPTSPLRNVEDIDCALEMLIKKDADGIVSVSECEHSPFWSNTLPDDYNMGSFIRDDMKGKRSQDLPKCYRLNGAIYAFTTESFIENSGIEYTNKVFGLVMSANRSVDIDNEIDFKLAEVLLADTA